MASKPRAKSAPAPAPGAVRGIPPVTQRPQLCSLVRQPPQGSGWFSEVKFDGHRFLAWKTSAGVSLVTRNGHDWADRLPVVARSIGQLSASTIVLDGELVALRPGGASSFPIFRLRYRPERITRWSSTPSICWRWRIGICGTADCSTESGCCLASATEPASSGTATTTKARQPCTKKPAGLGWRGSSASRTCLTAPDAAAHGSR